MDLIDSDEENISDEENYNIVVRISRERVVRTRINNFNFWNDAEFYKRFRISKHSAFRVLEEIRPNIAHPTTWNSAVSPECMLLLALRFYASGGMLISAGNFCGVSVSTASRIMQKVSHNIAQLRSRYIKFPSTVEEMKEKTDEFYRIAQFPRTLAALDCTHIRIQSPSKLSEEIFRNRKGFFSYNVQTMCDANLKIMDIVARWPGSTHNSTIFNNSRIRARFESGEFGDNIIVANSWYQCRSYLMTPLRNCSSPQENRYNQSLIQTRNCVERSYDLWKRRFPILATGLKLQNRTIQSVIVATAVIHNICCMNKDADPPPLDYDLLERIEYVNNVEVSRVAGEGNTSVRNVMINADFAQMLNENQSL